MGPVSEPPNEEVGALVETMAASEYLSAPRVSADLAAMSARREHLEEIATGLWAPCDRSVLVGSGGSYAAMLTAQYILNTVSPFPVHVSTGTDLIWRRPMRIGPGCAVLFTSFSGETTDILDALAAVKGTGARTLAITGRAGSTLDVECDESIVYAGNAIYEVPIVAIIRLFAGAGPHPQPWERLLRSVDALPDALSESLTNAPATMRTFAEPLAQVEHAYVLGSGPLSPLAYKLSPVLMENVRMGSSFIDTSEFRHGPIELLERQSPTVIALLGTDDSRDVSAGVFRFLQEQGANVHVLDAADYVVPHPDLAPLVLNSISQWLVGWMAHQRGIEDLDDRVYMGKGLLSAGQWP
ncbi:fructoselysine 6-phosphate deglycase [soil metagenome]